MNLIFLPILVMIFYPSLSLGRTNQECDPENARAFIERCGLSPKEMKPRIHKKAIWQGTDHSGYQLIDCQNGTIKNVITSSKESYSCQMLEKHFSTLASDKKLNEMSHSEEKDYSSSNPKTDEVTNPKKPSRASLQ